MQVLELIVGEILSFLNRLRNQKMSWSTLALFPVNGNDVVTRPTTYSIDGDG